MKIYRKWALPINVSEEWNVGSELAKHRIYEIWRNIDLFPCDDYGLRVPIGYKDIHEKYKKNKNKKKIFCFGGSTTFGWYVPYEDSYPHQLEILHSEKIAFFNVGICGSDISQNLYLLLDLIRIGLIPDEVIFLDGINEKQGFIQSASNRDNYEFKTNSYDYLIGKINKTKSNKIKRLINKIFKRKKIDNSKFLKFTRNQATEYILSYQIIRKICKSYSIKDYFFLQPTLWDVVDKKYDLDDEEIKRKTYLEKLYKIILSYKNKKIIKLSDNNLSKINSNMFIDWQHLDADGYLELAKIIKNY